MSSILETLDRPIIRSVERDSNVHVAARPAPAHWGGFSVCALVSSLGLLVVAAADTGGRFSAWWTDLAFWIGLLLLFIPAAGRLFSISTTRAERIALVSMLGMSLYLVKVIHSPLAFTFHDELIHWRTAFDISSTGALFRENPLIPVSPLYPGLEIVTSALSTLSGQSLFIAGVVVLAVARLVLVLALFVLYESVSGSARLAGLATLGYLTNPKLLFFDAQFSYESLALPLAILTIAAAAARQTASVRVRVGLTAVALLGLSATLITHHITSFTLVLFLALWAAVGFLIGGRRRQPGMPAGGLALLGFVGAPAWLVFIAVTVISYLAPHIWGALSELIQLIVGDTAGRELFRDPAGDVTPIWERVVAVSATLIILLGLPFGLQYVWRRQRHNALAVTLLLTALAYPASLAFRFTRAGAEASDRAAGFVFVGVAFVLAAGIIRFWPARGWPRRLGFSVLASVVYLGEIVVGAGPIWARTPGPYLVTADMRSVEPEGIAAANWSLQELGSDNRVSTDRINRLLMISYGQQYPVTHVRDGVDLSPVFTATTWEPRYADLLRAAGVRYLVIDWRLTTGLPHVGAYFENGEPGESLYLTPLAPEALAKFEALPGAQRVYDSGDICILDLGAWLYGA